jgi:hypothetical protein
VGNEVFLCKIMDLGFCKIGCCQGIFVDKTANLSQRTVNKDLKGSSRDMASCKDHNFHIIFGTNLEIPGNPAKKL